jgi:hypothetical protein
MLGWQGLTVGTVKHDWLSLVLTVPHMWVCSVGGHKRLSLRGHWGKHALLVEAHAIAAASIRVALESRASNLL